MAVTNLDHHDIPRDPFHVFTQNEIHPRCRGSIANTTVSQNGIRYFHLPPLTADILQENCTSAGTYDYFFNSELSYILTFSFVTAFIIGKLFYIYNNKNRFKPTSNIILNF